MPKLKKLRQWSHDSLANLSQLTSRSSNNVNPKLKRVSHDESNFPTNGISTISSAIREQRIDPKKDNFGLYALKCDRSSSIANARRGILLNLPTTVSMVKTKAEINSFQSVEQNHEAFQPVESTGLMYDGATSSASGAENRLKIEPPPRRKRRPTATRTIVTHPKQIKKPALKVANQSVVKSESLEKNDSGLYRIVGSTPENAKSSVEDPKKKEHVVMMVKPKVQKAVAVKTKPLQQQIVKVKSYEWNKHQRKSSIGNIPKPHFTKRYLANDSGSFKSVSSVDIFQSNKLMDQRKIFDEFDALFDKSKETRIPDLSEASPEVAFDRLDAPTFPSSSAFSSESGYEDKPEVAKAFVEALTTTDFYHENPANVVDKPTEVSSKPKIVYEQPKVVPGVIKKKILYYDDKNEFQQLIMNQNQSTTIINNHFSGAVLPPKLEGKVPISAAVDEATAPFDLNGNDEYRRPKASATTTNSNSLRIFSNEGIFVFNL